MAHAAGEWWITAAFLWINQHLRWITWLSVLARGRSRPVINIEARFSDQHLRVSLAYTEVEHPHGEAQWIYRLPWLLNGTSGGVRSRAPLLWQHNEHILCRLLGLSLRGGGVVEK